MTVKQLPYIYPCQPNRIDPESEFFVRLSNDANWAAEVKKNGWRCLAYRNLFADTTFANNLVLWTRHKTLIKDAVPQIRAELLTVLPAQTVIDGELIFTKRVKGAPDKFYAFDILYDRGVLVANEPLWRRRERLVDILEDSEFVEVAKQVFLGKQLLYKRVIEEDELAEGVVLKKIVSTYPVGMTSAQNNPNWLKVKKMEAWQKE